MVDYSKLSDEELQRRYAEEQLMASQNAQLSAPNQQLNPFQQFLSANIASTLGFLDATTGGIFSQAARTPGTGAYELAQSELGNRLRGFTQPIIQSPGGQVASGIGQMGGMVAPVIGATALGGPVAGMGVAGALGATRSLTESQQQYEQLIRQNEIERAAKLKEQMPQLAAQQAASEAALAFFPEAKGGSAISRFGLGAVLGGAGAVGIEQARQEIAGTQDQQALQQAGIFGALQGGAFGIVPEIVSGMSKIGRQTTRFKATPTTTGQVSEFGTAPLWSADEVGRMQLSNRVQQEALAAEERALSQPFPTVRPLGGIPQDLLATQLELPIPPTSGTRQLQLGEGVVIQPNEVPPIPRFLGNTEVIQPALSGIEPVQGRLPLGQLEAPPTSSLPIDLTPIKGTEDKLLHLGEQLGKFDFEQSVLPIEELTTPQQLKLPIEATKLPPKASISKQIEDAIKVGQPEQLELDSIIREAERQTSQMKLEPLLKEVAAPKKVEPPKLTFEDVITKYSKAPEAKQVELPQPKPMPGKPDEVPTPKVTTFVAPEKLQTKYTAPVNKPQSKPIDTIIQQESSRPVPVQPVHPELGFTTLGEVKAPPKKKIKLVSPFKKEITAVVADEIGNPRLVKQGEAENETFFGHLSKGYHITKEAPIALKNKVVDSVNRITPIKVATAQGERELSVKAQVDLAHEYMFMRDLLERGTEQMNGLNKQLADTVQDINTLIKMKTAIQKIKETDVERLRTKFKRESTGSLWKRAVEERQQIAPILKDYGITTSRASHQIPAKINSLRNQAEALQKQINAGPKLNFDLSLDEVASRLRNAERMINQSYGAAQYAGTIREVFDTMFDDGVKAGLYDPAQRRSFYIPHLETNYWNGVGKSVATGRMKAAKGSTGEIITDMNTIIDAVTTATYKYIGERKAVINTVREFGQPFNPTKQGRVPEGMRLIDLSNSKLTPEDLLADNTHDAADIASNVFMRHVNEVDPKELSGKKLYVVSDEVYNTIKDRFQTGPGAVDKFLRGVMDPIHAGLKAVADNPKLVAFKGTAETLHDILPKFKAQTTVFAGNPNIVNHILTNFIGDMERTIWFAPESFKQYPKAVKGVYNLLYGNKKGSTGAFLINGRSISPQELLDSGLISGLTMSELGGQYRQNLEYQAKVGNRVIKTIVNAPFISQVLKAVATGSDWLVNANTFREAVMRMAVGLDALEKGATIPQAVTKTGKALVDYGVFLEAKERNLMNGALAPFYTWAAQGVKDMARTFRGDYSASQLGRMAATSALLPVAVQVYNYTFFPKQAQELRETKGHLAVGPIVYADDKTIVHASLPTVSWSALSLLGVQRWSDVVADSITRANDPVKTAALLAQGKTAEWQKGRELGLVSEAAQNIYGMANPTIKRVIEATLTGEELYNQRPLYPDKEDLSGNFWKGTQHMLAGSVPFIYNWHKKFSDPVSERMGDDSALTPTDSNRVAKLMSLMMGSGIIDRNSNSFEWNKQQAARYDKITYHSPEISKIVKDNKEQQRTQFKELTNTTEFKALSGEQQERVKDLVTKMSDGNADDDSKFSEYKLTEMLRQLDSMDELIRDPESKKHPRYQDLLRERTDLYLSYKIAKEGWDAGFDNRAFNAIQAVNEAATTTKFESVGELMTSQEKKKLFDDESLKVYQQLMTNSRR